MNSRPEILVFGGTTEGRMLVEWLNNRNTCNIVACTATEYGSSLLPSGAHITTIQGPLSPDKKAALVRKHNFCCIVDATHPYATHISQSITQICADCGIDLIRIRREILTEGDWTTFNSPKEAATYLAGTTGNILLTTGSKDLHVYTSCIPHFEERLWVRVLPVAESVARASELGVPAYHIIAMQGPFSTFLNSAIIQEYEMKHLVTKQSGATGGFDEKVFAAKDCGINVIVVQCPQKEAGLNLAEAAEELKVRYGL